MSGPSSYSCSPPAGHEETGTAVELSLTQGNFLANVHQQERTNVADRRAGANVPRRYGCDNRCRCALVVGDLLRLTTMSAHNMATCSSFARIGHWRPAPRGSAHRRRWNLTPFFS